MEKAQNWQRNEQIFGAVVLDPKAATDIGRDNSDESLGQSRQLRDVAPQAVDGLTRRPNAQLPGAGIRRSDDALAFHRHAGIAVMMKTAAQSIWRLRQCGPDVALADLEFARDIRLELLVH